MSLNLYPFVEFVEKLAKEEGDIEEADALRFTEYVKAARVLMDEYERGAFNDE